MASTYSELKIELIGTGEQTGTWGSTTNDNFSIALNEAITGSATVSFSGLDITLTLLDTNAAQTARNLRLNLTGTSSGTRQLILGSGCQIEKLYLINNGLADAVTVKNTSGTGIAVPAGKTMFVYNNGTNVVDATTYLSSLTLGTALPITSGGTGATTLTTNNVLLGNGTSALQAVAPGTTGNVLTSNGTTWTSAAVVAALSGTTDSASPFETSLGHQAGNVNTGTDSTFIGYQAGLLNTTAGSNTAVGSKSFDANTTGSFNVALGVDTLGANTTGTFNTAVGARALDANTTGSSSTAVGESALGANTASGNTAVGFNALAANTTADGNTAVGTYALAANTTGINNVGIGSNTLDSNTTGAGNTAIGSNTLDSNTTGADNTAIGFNALGINTTGDNNVAVGANTMQGNTTSSNNVAVGVSALAVSTSADNVAVGTGALLGLTTGASNTAVGDFAGSSLTTGSNNTILGDGAQASSGSVSNTVTLGNSSIATLRCQVTTISSLSDARDKTNVKDIGAGLDFVNELKPVSFTWNMRDGGKVGIPDTGFIAQDLQAVQVKTGITIPSLVDAENPDKLEAGYGKLIPILVKAIQELSEEVKQLKK